MREWAKIGIATLVISLTVSFIFPAKPAVGRPQTHVQHAIQTVAPNQPGAVTASTLVVWAADSKSKSSNKGQRGKSSAAKDKPRKKTRDAGQKAHTDTIDKYWA